MTSENITPTPAQEPTRPTCPQCDAIRNPATKYCWLCHEPLSALPQGADANLAQGVRQPESRGYEAAWAVVAILGLLLVVGVIAVGAYGLLIFVLIVAVPVLIGAGLAQSRNRPQGAESGTTVFPTLGCFGTVALVGLGVFIAFFVTCLVDVINIGGK